MSDLVKCGCANCGCTKPCSCDDYSTGDTCARCGCTKPCACDHYTSPPWMPYESDARLRVLLREMEEHRGK